MLRRLAALIAVGVMASIVPLGASAHHNCDSNIIVFSGNSNQPVWINSNAASSIVTCDPDVEGTVDSRLINPGADQVSVSYIAACNSAPANPDTLAATVDGLGFNNQSVTLTCRHNDALGYDRFDGPRIPIPDGPAAQGAITVTIVRPFGTETNCFHTAGGFC